jgi:hypothetical protein
MVSVIPHQGGNANSHSAYINNYYNTGKYPSISIGTVFNIIVVRNGETVYKTTNTYIAETDKAYYKDYPIISLNMSYADWMDADVGMYNKYKEDLSDLCKHCALTMIFEKEYKNEIMFILEK